MKIRCLHAPVLNFIVLVYMSACFSCANKEPIISYTSSDSNVYQVAFLIMDGVYNTELTAPFDIFHHTKFRKEIKPMEVFTISKNKELVTSFEGLKIQPDYAYTDKNYPSIDILVIPSAEHHMDDDLKDEDMLSFVYETSQEAKYVTSHCDGAFVLAQTGLLENSVSTTFPSDISIMRDMFPELDIRDSVLFVHDGKFITSAGGAKSFEAALYLCEIMYGKDIAKQLAKGLVIDWNLDAVPHLVISIEADNK